MTITRTLGRALTLLSAFIAVASSTAIAQGTPGPIAAKATGFERPGDQFGIPD